MKAKIRKGIVQFADIAENKAGQLVIQSNEDFTKIGRLSNPLPLTGAFPILYIDGSEQGIVLPKEATRQFVVQFDEPVPEGLINETTSQIIRLRESDWEYALEKRLAYNQRKVSFVIREVETSNIIDFEGSEGCPVYESINVAVLTGPAWEKVAEKLYVGSKQEDDMIDWVLEEMSIKFYPPTPLQ